jgi:hypothetical protein
MREGRWASRARGSKWARAQGRVWRTRGHGRGRGGEIVGERLGTADRWERRERERERGHGEKNGADSSAPQSMSHPDSRGPKPGREHKHQGAGTKSHTYDA